MASKLTYMTSLRVEQHHHEIIKRFAEKFNVKPAYVYRGCIIEFIKKHSLA